jgi:uncharacterized protein YjbI with pentapeptide repeats
MIAQIASMNPLEGAHMQISLLRLRIQSFLLLAFVLLAARTGYAEIVAYHGTGRVDSILDLSGGAGVNGFFRAGDTITFRITYDTATAGGMSTFSANYPGAIKEFTFSYSNGYSGTAANGDVSLWNNFPLGLNNEPADQFSFESQPAHGLTAPDIGSAHIVNLNAFLLDSTAATALSSLNLVALPPFSAFSSTQFETIYQNSSSGTSYVKGRVLSLTRISAARRLYWSDAGAGKIQRSNLDGTGIQDVVAGLLSPGFLALDSVGSNMFWTDLDTQKIQRANLNGSNITDVLGTGSLTVPIGIALDLAGGKIYWTLVVGSTSDKIQRANLNGSMIEDLVTIGLDNPVAIALDVAQEKMYWTDTKMKKIQRANLNGSNVQDLVLSAQLPEGITLDLASGKMYWADLLAKKIQRANLDGSNVEDVIATGLSLPFGITLDLQARKIYWADFGGGIGDGRIQRSNLTGSNVETLITGLGTPRGVALELAPPNEAPVANAGADRAVRVGQTITLNGSASYDDNTATGALMYRWTVIQRPAGSNAVLMGTTTSFPTLQVDIHGTYVVQLVVTDAEGLTSAPDEVLISSENIEPTAWAGEDRLIITGEVIALDGSGSRDPENDVISFSWGIVSAPAGSTVQLLDPNTQYSRLIPDVEGQYEISLIVSDFLGPSLPDFVRITATNAETFAEVQIANGAETVTTLPPSSVTTEGNQSALNNFLIQATTAIQGGDLAEARLKLHQAIERTDGCVLRGIPDKNGPGRDWITDCAAQREAYRLLNDALAALSS